MSSHTPSSEGACAVPLAEQCEATLRHYEEVTNGREWDNQVPQAIRAWYAAKMHASETTDRDAIIEVALAKLAQCISVLAGQDNTRHEIMVEESRPALRAAIRALKKAEPQPVSSPDSTSREPSGPAVAAPSEPQGGGDEWLKFSIAAGETPNGVMRRALAQIAALDPWSTAGPQEIAKSALAAADKIAASADVTPDKRATLHLDAAARQLERELDGLRAMYQAACRIAEEATPVPASASDAQTLLANVIEHWERTANDIRSDPGMDNLNGAITEASKALGEVTK